MSVRSVAFQTRRRATAHAPINKRTRYHRRQMERWPEQRVADLRQSDVQSSHERYQERKAVLTLLAASNANEYERVTREHRERRNVQQQARRQRNKLAPKFQVMKLLKQLEAELSIREAVVGIAGNKKEKDLKYGTIRAPLIDDFIDRLQIRKGKTFCVCFFKPTNTYIIGRLFVDVGSGLGLVGFHIALLTGADVVSIEIRPELHALAVEIGRRLEAECVRRGWLGVGRWTLLCGDAREILLDESIVWSTSAAAAVDEPIVVSVVNNAATATTTPIIRRCLYSLTDYLFFNNWAFGDVLSIELLHQYGQLAPIDGQAVFIRNPLPRYRPGSAVGGGAALAAYELPQADAQVYDVPAGGIDWRDTSGVHWTALRVLPLGVRQSSTQVVARKFAEMSRSVMP